MEAKKAKTTVFVPEMFSINELQQVIKHFAGKELTDSQMSQSLNPLHRKSFLKFKAIHEIYMIDQPEETTF